MPNDIQTVASVLLGVEVVLAGIFVQLRRIAKALEKGAVTAPNPSEPEEKGE